MVLGSNFSFAWFYGVCMRGKNVSEFLCVVGGGMMFRQVSAIRKVRVFLLFLLS